jgi:hypothetical protein
MKSFVDQDSIFHFVKDHDDEVIYSYIRYLVADDKIFSSFIKNFLNYDYFGTSVQFRLKLFSK